VLSVESMEIPTQFQPELTSILAQVVSTRAVRLTISQSYAWQHSSSTATAQGSLGPVAAQPSRTAYGQKYPATACLGMQQPVCNSPMSACMQLAGSHVSSRCSEEIRGPFLLMRFQRMLCYIWYECGSTVLQRLFVARRA